ncbi:hypothetical protein OWV82_016857 [Melia azedarach]|uniref:Uncharacterized protein n=1 Tax=Melia azedarach TaxID=155640 RepID=A0ACC1XHD6_MELAZ|nr:hypothetical protein OWV82_016857 [Melia azedarach]
MKNIKNKGKTMQDSDAEFPGFQICVHKDEFLFKRSLSRLQRRAPCPLKLIKPNAASLECKGVSKAMGCNLNSTSAAAAAAAATAHSSSSFSSFYQSKDPIPLLSPLVSPSLLESSYIQEGNTAKSH